MQPARKPPYPRSPHTCPRCKAWSPDPWAWKKPHHCKPDTSSVNITDPLTTRTDTFTEEGGDDGTRVQPDQADDLE